MTQKILCYSSKGTSIVEVDPTELEACFSKEPQHGMVSKGENFTSLGNETKLELWTPLKEGVPYVAYGLLSLEAWDKSDLEFVVEDSIGKLLMLKDLVPLVSSANLAYDVNGIRDAIGNPEDYKDVPSLVASLDNIFERLRSM